MVLQRLLAVQYPATLVARVLEHPGEVNALNMVPELPTPFVGEVHTEGADVGGGGSGVPLDAPDVFVHVLRLLQPYNSQAFRHTVGLNTTQHLGNYKWHNFIKTTCLTIK